ncbi:MAG TPA: DUF1302 family protein [Methylomirabilota bacterium]|jgi:hypothetical protein|nr:DUF1302 family protein [Methylomirabilota bacterium]
MRLLALTAVVLALCGAAGAEDAERESLPDWLKALRVRGRLAEEFAYRLHDPGDVSKLKTIGWLEGKYAFSEAVSLRVATRAWYDAVFEATDRYPANVERDQKFQFDLREALLSISRGDFDLRLGRQQIVWGEAIGTFITDVVNPRDFREFLLPEFSELRIPIWALDFTYRLRQGLTFEGVWTPDTRINTLPKQGAEFQFAPIPYRFRNPVVHLPDNPDEFSLARSEGGFRLSALVSGWDMSLIYYDQADKTLVLFQRRVPQPGGPDVVVLEPKHPRLHIVAATLAKSVEPVVLRGEVAVSVGKRYVTTDPLDGDGVVRRDTIDYLVGVDYTFASTVDAALQVSQKILTGSASNLTRGGVEGRVTTSVALRLTTGFFDNTLNPTVLFVVNANRGDFRLSPRIDYLLSGAVTLSVGADLFEGSPRTLYGQFDRNDRVWVTATWRF